MKKIYLENSMKNFEMILKLNVIVFCSITGSFEKSFDNFLRLKISEKCQLKHLKHVCIILMMKKSFFYSLSNQVIKIFLLKLNH